MFLCAGLLCSELCRCRSSCTAWGQITIRGGEVDSSAPAEPVRQSGLIYHHAASLLCWKMRSEEEEEDMADRSMA